MSEKKDNGGKKMTPSDARRIQRHADRTGRNDGFKRRSQRAAGRNAGADKSGGGGKKK